MDFDKIATEQFVRFMLVLCRVGGILLVTPLLGGPHLALRVRVLIAAAISVAVYPLVPLTGAAAPTEGARLVLGLAGELCVGLVCGFVVNMVFVAARMAGSLLSTTMGTGLTEMMNPTAETQLPVLSEFYTLFAVVAFFAVNGHHVLLAGLVRSFERVPLMGAGLRPGMVTEMAGLLGDMFVLMIKLAAPTLAVLFVMTVALGVVSRIVPQGNVAILGFPLTACAGMVAVSLTLAAAAMFLGDSATWAMNQVDVMLRLMAGRA
jgi:flagellar biosynthetic protein FliR